MSANELKLCRSCGEDISSLEGTPERCPYCTAKLKIATSKFYGSPDYLCHQRNSLLEDLKLSKLYPGDSKHDRQAAEIQNEMVRWARACPDEDKIAAMMDAEIILKELLHSDASGATMSNIVRCAKNLSKLADVLENYFKQGGSPHDREIRHVLPEFRDDGGYTAAAAKGGASGE